jgi:tape measure domain-containing protein
MSTTVDNRVVAMKFDNKQFESGVGTSLSTLDKLKKGLNLEGSAKGLDGIGAAAKKVSFDGMASGIDVLKVKFSALQVVAVTTLANITNSALGAGKRLISSLTIDPVTSGFKEYETQMNAIQTILANTSSKGTNLSQVKDALAELNTYSDKTIYNFTEMAKNIGTFTAAGVALKPATAAIKGIANLAAVSGSTSEQASTAMYQLSQAMASGAVKLQDWNSVVNAGMGGEVFQKSLMETARNHGINIDKMVKNEGSFRETLKSGWLSTSVLTETLSKFTGDLNAKQLKALGYSEKQTAEIIKMAKTASDAATKVKTFSQLLDTLKEAAGSGWAKTWELVFGDFNEAKGMFTGVSNVLGGIIGASADARNNLLSGWKDLGGRTVLIDTIRIAFENVRDVINSVTSAFKEIFPPTTAIQLFNITVGLQGLVKHFALSKAGLENLHKTFAGFFSVIDIGLDIVKFVASALGLVAKAIFPVTGGVLTVTGGFGDFLVMIHNVIESSNIFGIALSAIAKTIDLVKSVLSPFISKIKEFVNTSTLLEDVMDFLKVAGSKLSDVLRDIASNLPQIGFSAATTSSGILSTAFTLLAEAGHKVKEAFFGAGETINNMKPGLEKVGSVLKSIFGPAIDFVITKLRELTLGDVGRVLSGGAFFMIAKSIKDAMTSVKGVTSGFSAVIDGISGSLVSFQTKLKADALFKIAAAIGLLALSIVALSMIEPEDLYKALTALTILFTELSVGLMILQKTTISSAGLSGKLIALGIAVMLMASAVKKLSDIDSAKLGTAVGGLASILAVLALFIKVTAGVGIQSSMMGLIGISTAILILCSAVALFGSMDEATLTQGTQGIISSLMILAVFIKSVGNPERMVAIGVGMTAIAVAMNIFAAAIAIFGNMDLVTLAKGLWTMGISLGIMVVAITALSNGGALAGAAALLIVAIAINILVPAIAILGNLELSTIGIALLALAGVFVVLGIAGAVLAPLAPIILTLAAAIGLIGIGVYLLGGGLVLFAAGLAALAAGSGIFIAAFVGVVIAILGLIPTIAQKLGEGIVAFAQAIAKAMPELMTAVKVVANGLIKAFSDLIIPVVEAAVKFLIALLLKIGQYIGPLIDAGSALIVGFIKGITKNLPAIVGAAADLMIAFMKAVAGKLPDIVRGAIDIILAFISGIVSKIDDVIDAAFKVVIGFINGLADAIRNNSPAINSACKNLITAIVDAIMSFRSTMLDIGVNMIKGIIEGIKSMAGNIAGAALDVVGGAFNGVKSFLGIHSPSRLFRDEVGVMIGKGMAEGIKDSTPEVVTASSKMAQAVVDAAKKWIDERKYYNKISLEEELYVWETIQKKYKAGTDARIEADREVYRLKNELITKEESDNAAVFSKYKEQLSDAKYFNKISLEEEYDVWKVIQLQYKEGSKERIEADKEVYRLKNELIKKEEADAKALSDLTTAYSEKVTSIEKNTADKRKAMQDDYYAKTKEINDKQVADIQALNKTYDDAVDSRSKSLYSTYGLFDKVTAAEPTKGTDLIKNLQDQAAEFESWKKNMDGLSKRGISSDLLKELTDMGPKAGSQIKALNDLTAPELDTYVSLWQSKHDEAKTRAISELEGLRLETVNKINQINSDSATALYAYNQMFVDKMKVLTDESKVQLDALEVEWRIKFLDLKAAAVTSVTTMTEDIKTTVTTMKTDTETIFTGLTDSIKTIMATPDWNSVGANIIDGIRLGATSKAVELSNEVARIAFLALMAAKSTLGIHSPSTEFAKVGAFAGQGLINGLSSYGSKVATSATDLGNGAINAISNAISSITDIVNGNIDAQPVIRPVLDLTDIMAGGKQINCLINQNGGISLGSIERNFQGIGRTDTVDNTSPQQTGQNKQGATIHFEQNNYSPTALSRLDIYRQTKNQISTMKGVVGTV